MASMMGTKDISDKPSGEGSEAHTLEGRGRVKRAVFLDRDGVVNEEKGHVFRKEDFTFVEGIFELCRYFEERGYLIFIISNQSGIARGYYTLRHFRKITSWMVLQFSSHGVKVSGVYFCPHHPDFTGECHCRKPKPGMLLAAQKEHGIDLRNSIIIGNREIDIEAGLAAGLKRTILVRKKGEEDNVMTRAKIVVDSIMELMNYFKKHHID